MSSVVRNTIVAVSFIAMVLGAVRAVAALPEALHGFGVVAPHTFEAVLLDCLEGRL